jgi:hypothetical protein
MLYTIFILNSFATKQVYLLLCQALCVCVFLSSSDEDMIRVTVMLTSAGPHTLPCFLADGFVRISAFMINDCVSLLCYVFICWYIVQECLAIAKLLICYGLFCYSTFFLLTLFILVRHTT